MSKTFCILPWMHLATNASGNLRVCCNSIPGQNFITKEDGTPFKLNKDNLEEAWNSEVYKKIRKQMLDGERPEMCTRCFRKKMQVCVVQDKHGTTNGKKILSIQ